MKTFLPDRTSLIALSCSGDKVTGFSLSPAGEAAGRANPSSSALRPLEDAPAAAAPSPELGSAFRCFRLPGTALEPASALPLPACSLIPPLPPPSLPPRTRLAPALAPPLCTRPNLCRRAVPSSSPMPPKLTMVSWSLGAARSRLAPPGRFLAGGRSLKSSSSSSSKSITSGGERFARISASFALRHWGSHHLCSPPPPPLPTSSRIRNASAWSRSWKDL